MIMMAATTACLASPIDWDNFNSSLIIEVTRPTGVFTCSGVAINDSTVLTAAHCLDGEILKVKVFNQSSYNPQDTFWTISTFEIHPAYDVKKSNYQADIAKIKLTEKLPSTTIFFPIIKRDDQIMGKILRLGFGGRSNKNIRTLVTPEYRDIRKHENTLELEDHFSFSGDSGGPIFIQNQGQMYLVALHSTLSYGPEGKFSFNPLLSSHRQWLEN